MPKTANILPPDPYDRNLMETFISLQKQLLAGQHRIEQRLDAMEAQLCQPKKHKKKEELVTLFTTDEVVENYNSSRQTLFNDRKRGILKCSKRGNRIRYTKEDIDNYREILDSMKV